MFKQLKTVLLWYYLFKFRKRIIFIILLLIIAIFANSIYVDVVEYLKLKNKLEYLEVVIISKWLIILFNITFSVYLILTIFDKSDNKKEQVKNEDLEVNVIKKEEHFSSKEKEFLYKKKLRTKADFLLNK